MILARVQRLFFQIKQQFLVPLYANAYALIFNQFASAAMGMLYWAAAARLYSTEMVGQNTAIISTMLFLSALAELSLKAAMTRFVPRAGKQIVRLLIYTYVLNITAAMLVTIAFFALGRYFNFTFALLADTRLLPLLLLIAPITWTIFYVEDGILIGLREAKWVLYENSIYNFSKIVILIIISLVSDNRYGVVASWFLPVPFLILLVNGFIFFKFVPRYLAQSHTQPASITPKQIASSVAGDHIGTIFAEACVRLLPLLVLNVLGKSANAYFYQAWLVGNTIYLIAYNMASSFSVEASSNLQQIAVFSRRILIQKGRLVVPLALGVLVLAPLVLRIFGEEYAENGTVLLRWLALAAFPMILNIWYLGYARVVGKIGKVIRNQAVMSILTLGLSYIGLPILGITSVGIAWFVAQTVVALIVGIETAPILLSRQIHIATDENTSINVRLRRADWRFLSSNISPRRSIVFSSGFLAEAVKAITIEETAIGKNVESRDFDLAVAANPSGSVLNSAFRALGPGGVFYSEWAAWRMGGARGIQARLHRAGFETIKLFWAYPSVDNPHLWLPLDSSYSLYSYLADQFIPGEGSWRAFVRKILSVFLRVFIRTGLVPTLSAVAYKESAKPFDVIELVRKEWPAQSQGVSADRLSFLMQTGGSQLFSKIIFSIFSPHDLAPCWIVKLPRMPQDGQTIKHEENILWALRGDQLQNYKDVFLPRILFSRDWNGVWLSAQTALSGVPLNKLVANETVQDIANRITDWQVALANLSRRRETQPPLSQIVERILAKLDLVAASRLTSGDFAHARAILLSIRSVPLVCAHNDFAPWNVMQTDEGLGVFDWADADWNSLPLMDLVYGLSNLAFLSEDAWDVPHMVQVYRSLLDPGTAFGKIFGQSLTRYAAAIGVNQDDIAPLRLATWITHCYFEYSNRKVEMGGPMKPGLQPQDEGVCFPLFRAELEWSKRNLKK